MISWVSLVAAVVCLGGCGGSEAGDETDGTLGGSGGARVIPPDLGEPINVEQSEEWVWVPIEGSLCADGTEAGVGVNFTGKSRDLVVWFQGNGVCIDPVTCGLFESLLTGMGPDPLTHLWWNDPFTRTMGIFNRLDPENPLRDANYVAFPHCGVDGHTADKVSSYPSFPTVHQHGYANVTKALRRIVPTFLDAGKVVVAGFSAGGIGAGANYHQIATAFEAVGQPPPFLIDDGGPVLRPPYLGDKAREALRAGWGLDATLGTFCPECATEGYHKIHEKVATLHPGARASVVCAYGDGVATPLYALLNGGAFDGARMEAGLKDLSTWSSSFQGAVGPSVQRELYYPGTRHGALVVAPLGATPGLPGFLADQLSGSDTWTTVH